MARHNIITPNLIDGKLAIRFTVPGHLPQDNQRRLKEAYDGISTRELVKLWLHSQLAVGGPRVFQPTFEQGLAMEQVAPRIPICEYARPYPLMVIDLPDGYRQQRTAAFGSAVSVAAHGPAWIVIATYGIPPWTFCLSLVFDSGIELEWALVPSDATIEDGIVREFGAESYLPPDLSAEHIGNEERPILAGLIRLAVNAMLLLADFGCKHLGPVNEPYYRRLEHYEAIARKRGAGVVNARRDLRMAAQLYGFSQDIVLYGEDRSPAAPDGSGAEPHRRPHWRRGHWKTHAHGPDLSLRKRLFTKPVLVNRHLLREGEGISQTTYRMPDPPRTRKQ